MERLHIQHLGPIENADVTFGDFTLLVGPQASGKSIFLQMVKLIEDRSRIEEMLKKYGYVWKDESEFLELFLGEGMAQIWTDKSKIEVDETINANAEFEQNTDLSIVSDKVFYIPAQRVLALQNGWPKPFSDFGNDPFVLKAFSENLRQFMEMGIGHLLAPENVTDKQRDHLYKSVYYEGNIATETSGFRKRFTLNIGGSKMPFMAWSAGQKEFMPLWLSMGILFHPFYPKDKKSKFVIVEEPEMGLHPDAIKHVIVQLLELIHDGFKVIISTHSPVFLEFLWAIKILKDNNAHKSSLAELFELNYVPRIKEAFQQALEHKTFKTYYFNRNNGKVNVEDISTLDAGSDNPGIADWGGITSFASRAAEIAAKNIAI